ncbi:MAG: hypothetical protein JWO67_4533 [Streptosporangiaceae bacterium]|nr:hypothetical protein [Streptosporangiaceae bacterium]
MKFAALLTALAAAASLTGCAAYRPNGSYGVYYENAFLYSCELRARVAYCSCMLGYLEQTVSAQQADYDGNAIATGAPVPAYVQTGAALCQWAVL